jgi:hypothetical protein
LDTHRSLHNTLLTKLPNMMNAAGACNASLTSKLKHHYSIASCLPGTIPVAADIALHSPSAIHPIDPYAWSSPFLLCLNATTSNFLSHISGHPVLHFHSSSPQWTITHALISMGCLGFQDYATGAVASFIVPLVRSICYATTSVHPKHSENTCLLPGRDKKLHERPLPTIPKP